MMLRILIFSATVLFAHGALHEQIEAVNRALALTPRNAALYIKRGELRRMHQEWLAATSDFNQALTVDPHAADALLGLARLASDQNAATRADSLACEYLRARPDSEIGYAFRAGIRARLQRPEAAEDWAAAIRLASEPSVEHYLGLAAALAHNGRETEAVQAIDSGIARMGPLVVLEQWAIDYLVQHRRWDAALARQERIVSAAPRKESALTRQAEILAAAGRAAQAQSVFQTALTAWEQLPERLRQTKAMQELRLRIGAGLTGTSPRSAQTAAR